MRALTQDADLNVLIFGSNRKRAGSIDADYVHLALETGKFEPLRK